MVAVFETVVDRLGDDSRPGRARRRWRQAAGRRRAVSNIAKATYRSARQRPQPGGGTDQQGDDRDPADVRRPAAGEPGITERPGRRVDARPVEVGVLGSLSAADVLLEVAVSASETGWSGSSAVTCQKSTFLSRCNSCCDCNRTRSKFDRSTGEEMKPRRNRGILRTVQEESSDHDR